tara:strand:+ start:382 stop:531 length:150 start_codon:yes stop_codon:yes gene_type:complete
MGTGKLDPFGISPCVSTILAGYYLYFLSTIRSNEATEIRIFICLRDRLN